MVETAMACPEGQEKICALIMDSISKKLDDLVLDLQAQKLLEESHAKEIFGKIDHLSDLISGGGRQGTGIVPRLQLQDNQIQSQDKRLAKIEDRFDRYVEDRDKREKRIIWGILTAIGTACLGILTQFVGGKL